MKRFISFGSIPVFRNIIQSVEHTAAYMGQDKDDNAIIKENPVLPKVEAIASEKIHGTNAGVCFSNSTGFWVQSRKDIITETKDNAGCAFAATSNQKNWTALIQELAHFHKIDLNSNIISLYFEWAGGNIQGSKSACSKLDKRAIIFQYFKVSPLDQSADNPSIWLPTFTDRWVDDSTCGIFNIMNYKTWKFEIDFSKPKADYEKIKTEVDTLEKNSIVGSSMGINGNVGEGLVLTFTYKNIIFRFKVKGEEHSKGSGKIKKLNPIDEVFEQCKVDFVNNHAINNSRLEQAWQSTFGIDDEKMKPTIKATGLFLKEVIKDVLKEEIDVMKKMKIEPKLVNGMISKVAREWFIDQLNKRAGL